MNGRTHRYIAFVVVILAVALLSAFATKGFWMPIFIFGVMGLSILLYGRAAALQITKDEIEKEHRSRKEEKDPHLIDKLAKITWLYQKMEGGAWVLLFFNMIFTIFTADFLPDLHRGVSIGIALLAIPIAGIAGSFFPDWDWDWGSKFHRNPMLHSYLIPFSIWIFGMIVFPYSFRYLNIISGLFCVAFATHLIADCVPATTKGLGNILKEFFDFSQSPGDLRQLPEHWEHKWLSTSGFILIMCFVFSIPRMYGTPGFDWAGVDEDGVLIWSAQIMTLIIVAIVGIVGWFAVFFEALSLKKKPKQSQSKHKAKALQELAIAPQAALLERNLPQIKQEVAKIFQIQPVISTRALLFKELEKASQNLPVEDVYQRLKSEKFIVFSRSSPSGFSLATDQSKQKMY